MRSLARNDGTASVRTLPSSRVGRAASKLVSHTGSETWACRMPAHSSHNRCASFTRRVPPGEGRPQDVHSCGKAQVVARSPVAELASHHLDVPDFDDPEPEEPPPQTPVAGFGERSTGSPGGARGPVDFFRRPRSGAGRVSRDRGLVAVVTSGGGWGCRSGASTLVAFPKHHVGAGPQRGRDVPPIFRCMASASSWTATAMDSPLFLPPTPAAARVYDGGRSRS